ncbi:MAG: hypothetical protein QG646_278 [Euryarchaeota archaeon]|nr:hypothetical protein [Euryarchaeota archaeon]
MQQLCRSNNFSRDLVPQNNVNKYLTHYNIRKKVDNETAIIGSSSGSNVSYSQVVTLYGIPVVYIVIVALILLFIFYLVCRMKRKERHSMKKSSYIKLFIVLFVPLFIYNLYNICSSLWFVNPHFLFIDPSGFIIGATILSLMESIFPYSFITLSILIINCYRK